MKIALTVSLEETVPPAKYGGTELVVYNVAEELVKLGHEVYLLGTGDSHTSAQLVPIIDRAIRNAYGLEEIQTWREYWKIAGVADMLFELDKIKPDVIHNNFMWRLVIFENSIKYPMFSTMHGPLTDLKEVTTYRKHQNHPYVSISNNQRTAIPELNWIDTVYNGIDLSAFPQPDQINTQRDYFVFLGRTSPNKGLAEIVQMIRKTKHKLKIAAKVDSVDVQYFETEVKPFIDGQQIEFLGEVDHAGKVELLRKAKALLLWLNWEEPFGLVVTEAMACGAPVIVNPRGSMRELVLDKHTGFLVNSLDEMQQQLDHVTQIRSEDCRVHVEKHFSSAIMAERYLEVARKVIDAYEQRS